ncbi:MAG: DUF1700 domain-containing protein [Acholeplasmatales bacterium]|nr:MAG: DUF1700 domain-containing protein [Acholeplasmatales bacterium]
MKEKFLNTLKRYLEPLSESERDEILDFYEERFATGMQYEGKTAADIVAELESPETIARNVLKAYGYTSSTPLHQTDGLKVWPIVGIILFDMFVAIWLVPALFGIIVGFGGAFIGLLVGAFGAVFVPGIVDSIWQTIFLLGFSFLWLMLVIWLYELGISFASWLVRTHMQVFNIGDVDRVDKAFRQLRVEHWMRRIPALRRVRNVLALIAVTFVMVGGVLSVSQLGVGAFSIGEPLHEESDSIDVSEDILENRPWQIMTDLDLGDIRIIRTAGTEIIVTSHEHEQAPVTITIDSETRIIELENNFSGRINSFNFLFFGLFQRAGVIIEVPENLELHDLVLETMTGRVEVRGFILDSLDITVLTGSVTLRDLEVEGAFRVRSTTGTITLRQVTGVDLDLRTTTGSIDINQSTFDTAILRVTTGSIKLKDIQSASSPAKTLQATTTTGSVRLENVYVLDLTLTTTTGSIHYNNADKSFIADRIRSNTTTGSSNITVQERP